MFIVRCCVRISIPYCAHPISIRNITDCYIRTFHKFAKTCALTFTQQPYNKC
nr:unknown [Pieris rapae granulovirus]